MRNWVLILGASSGFGAATAKEFAKEGFHIIGVHLDRAATMDAVKQLISEIESAGVQAKYFNVNAADAEKRKIVLDEVEVFFNKGEDNIKCLMHSLAFGTLKPYIADEPKDDLNQK